MIRAAITTVSTFAALGFATVTGLAWLALYVLREADE